MKKSDGFKVVRYYVDHKALLNGDRIERQESDFTIEKLNEIRKKQTERLMNSLGYIKDDKL